MRYLNINAMKYLISYLFFFFAVISASAQRSDTIKAKFYIDGHFYKELPVEMRKSGFKMVGAYQLQDSTQNGSVYEIVLPEGVHLSDKSSQSAIPDKNVFCRELLLSTSEFYKLTAKSSSTPTLKVGDALPDFSVKDNNGHLWSKKDLKGKAVLLNFWYTGCIPCLKEMPEISQWVQRYPKAICLAVTYQPARFINPVVRKRGFAFHQLVDASDFWKKMGIKSTPTTFVVDKDGIIRLITVGTNEEKRKGLEDMLKVLTATM